MIRRSVHAFVFFVIWSATAGWALGADDAHWAFAPPVRPVVPDDGRGDGTPIDAFVLAKLREAGLELNKPASRERLIRRAFLDLTGLLPERDDVEDFVGDERPDAWEQVDQTTARFATLRGALGAPLVGPRQIRRLERL